MLRLFAGLIIGGAVATVVRVGLGTHSLLTRIVGDRAVPGWVSTVIAPALGAVIFACVYWG